MQVPSQKRFHGPVVLYCAMLCVLLLQMVQGRCIIPGCAARLHMQIFRIARTRGGVCHDQSLVHIGAVGVKIAKCSRPWCLKMFLSGGNSYPSCLFLLIPLLWACSQLTRVVHERDNKFQSWRNELELKSRQFEEMKVFQLFNPHKTVHTCTNFSTLKSFLDNLKMHRYPICPARTKEHTHTLMSSTVELNSRQKRMTRLLL